MRRMTDLVYLNGYPPHVLERVSAMLSEGTLAPWLAQRYPEKHSVQTDKALYDFAIELKQRYLKNAAPLAKVLFDNQMVLAGGTLGTNTFAARVQGGNLKRKNEIRIASLFRQAPPEFLRMIVVHELAHLKEKDHNKAFYQLCSHMEPDYHQLEFDLRLWLTLR
ncbi:M48 family metallopeptidase [Amantichitinum ursilacus]|uniref:WLM domain protein n=1 Tax=Amantichitinum ursilacus TaxID=857265 RepID=A0A0N0XG40_9NEIS|nr:M48 family metallopeptidase [Amantichitinum ursilacus]KPC49393.1 WLM domain protein [Amantichitinum ursilacus]